MQLEERIVRQFPEGWKDFFIVDMDGDRDDDLLLDGPNGLLWLRIMESQLMDRDEGAYRTAGCIAHVHDVTGDGMPEFFFRAETAEGIVISCHDWFSRYRSKESLYALPPYLARTGRENKYGPGIVHVFNCFDADGDGMEETYLAVNAYQSEPYPRSLLVIDARSGRMLRHYDVGPYICNVLELDDQRRGSRIIVTSHACQNGARWNGTSDSLSYIFCFEPNLDLAWRQVVTRNGGWSDVAIGDINNDGTQEIFATAWFGNVPGGGDDKDAWTVAILDPFNGGRPLYKKYLNTGADKAFLTDIIGDAKLEALAVGQNGALFILDHELDVIAKCEDRFHRYIHHVTDIDGDGSKEIVCSGGGLLMIRDRAGMLMAETAFANNNNNTRVGIASVGETRMLAAINEMCLRFYSYHKTPFVDLPHGSDRDKKIPRIFLIIAMLLGILVGAAGALIVTSALRRRRKAIDRELRSADDANDALLTAMIAYNHGKSSKGVINRLGFLLKNRELAGEEETVRESTFFDLVTIFNSSIVPEIETVAALARKAGAAARCWREIAHHAHRASDLLPAIFMPEAGGPHVDDANAESALEALGAIEQCMRDIEAHLHAIYRIPVVMAVIRSAARCRNDLEQIGILPTTSYHGAEEESAFVSPHAFDKIMDDLILNGVRAMEQSAAPELRIAIFGEGDYIKIDVTDTGCGIAEPDREKVFDRDYTTKPEGGFGLFYARSELARFGAKIFVKESAQGIGTTFRIVMRRS